jgi:AraC-like DNA-binding protein
MSFFRAFIKVMGITPTEYQSDPSKFLIKAWILSGLFRNTSPSNRFR